MKDSTFNRENYNDGETVKQKNRLFLENISGYKNTVQREFKMQREILRSDHKFYSLGVFPQKPIEFTTLPFASKKFLGFSEFDGIYSIQFSYSLDFFEHQRQIYSPLDFLGDVGGLADALLAIGAIAISTFQFLFGNPMTEHMIKKIFEKDNSMQSIIVSHNFALRLLSKRKRAKIGKTCLNTRRKLTQI